MKNFILKCKIVFFKLTQNPILILQVKNGRISTIKGSPKVSFISDCSDIIRNNKLSHGLIYVTNGRYGKSVLKASSEISKSALQQLRNIWSLY